jgi:hypothetical protein
MEVFQNAFNLLKTAMSGLSDLVTWFINFRYDFGGWTFDFLGLHFAIPEFHVNPGVLVTAGFLGVVVVLLIIHLINVVTG